MLPILAAEEGGGLHFPSIEELVEWPAFLFEDTPFALNKIGLIALLGAGLTLLLFFLAGKRGALVPRGVQTVVEASVDFVRDGIVLQTMGEEGLHRKWVMPFLTSLFWFILFANVTSFIPPFVMPASARMALPGFLAILVLVLFIVVGMVNQGPVRYFVNALFPPGLPKGLYVIVTPIEFLSTFLIRPFSLAVRLFANTLAGHILLATFAVLSAGLWTGSWVAVFWPFPVLMLVLMTLFEVLVAFLQAYIFTILTAVYLGGAMHPEH